MSSKWSVPGVGLRKRRGRGRVSAVHDPGRRRGVGGLAGYAGFRDGSAEGAVCLCEAGRQLAEDGLGQLEGPSGQGDERTDQVRELACSACGQIAGGGEGDGVRSEAVTGASRLPCRPRVPCQARP